MQKNDRTIQREIETIRKNICEKNQNWIPQLKLF